MLDFLFDVIAGALAWFYSLWPSFGMAIVLLTMTAMIVITPLILKSTRSMLLMQQYQPELKRIQNQYRGDPQARNQVMMAFYKENGLNPMGSCLPLLVQAPIFLVLFRVLNGLTRRTTEIGTQLGFTAGRGATGADPAATTVSVNEQTFDPDYLSPGTELYQRLNQETEMVSWGVDLSRSASSAWSDGIIPALPYLLMILIVLVTGLYQHRQMQQRQSGAAINPQMQMVMRFMPYFLPIVSWGIQAGVVVYFIVSALYRIGQQAYITRTLYAKEDSPGAMLTKKRTEASEIDEAGIGAGKGITQSKGAPTPKRDTPRDQKGLRRSSTVKPSKPKREVSQGQKVRSQRSSSTSGSLSSGRGRTGKAPSRARTGSGRTTPAGGRITPSGSGQSQKFQNRSKKKRKRR